MRKVCLGLLLLAPVAPAAAQPTKVPAGTPVTIVVKPAEPAALPVSITLGGRHAHVTPARVGCTHTAGGNIDVAQPSPDTVVVTMTGVAVAAPHPFKGSAATLNFDLNQCFEVTFDSKDVKRAKLMIEGRVIGLLRSGRGGGTAEEGNACATITCDPVQLATLCVPPHSVGGCGDESINCREGVLTVPIQAGKYTLHQTFRVAASHGKGVCGKAASAEFAPDALDPLWISAWEPFRGAAKKDFGFQIIIRVAADDSPAPAPGGPEQLPPSRQP